VGAADANKGRLRQGILVGTHGILVRLQPNQCHPIAVSEFIDARIRVTDGDDGTSKDFYRIETTRSPIEFFAERIVSRPRVFIGRIDELRRRSPKD
jgi:hypothetical protein